MRARGHGRPQSPRESAPGRLTSHPVEVALLTSTLMAGFSFSTVENRLVDDCICMLHYAPEQ